MGLTRPTHPPMTPALETSVRRSLTSSILLLETSPVRRAQTGMCIHSPGLCDVTGHSWLICSPDVSLDIWGICPGGGQLSAGSGKVILAEFSCSTVKVPSVSANRWCFYDLCD